MQMLEPTQDWKWKILVESRLRRKGKTVQQGVMTLSPDIMETSTIEYFHMCTLFIEETKKHSKQKFNEISLHVAMCILWREELYHSTSRQRDPKDERCEC